MRNQMEIKKAQQVSSMEHIHKVDKPSGFEGVAQDCVDVVSELTASSDAVCQSESTIEGPEEEMPLFSRRRRNTIHASLIDIKVR